MTVAKPADWLTYAALLAVTLTAVAWSIFGTMATRVSGNGILVAEGGAIFSPVANSDGLVVQMGVAPGAHVVAGQRLARIAQPDVEEQLTSARAVEAEYNAQLGALGSQVRSYAQARARNLTAEEQLLEEQRRDAQGRAKEIGDQLQLAKTLLQRGIVTRTKVSELSEQYAAANQAVTEAGGRLMKATADEISTRNGDDRDMRASQSKLSEAHRRVRDLVVDLDRRQWVLSPAAGRVVEIKAPAGSRVTAGTPIVAIENGSASLQMIGYVPPRDGKLVRPGMAVNISPSVAKREEYGTITGRVVAVSDFPATVQAMQATLQNDQLVKDFSQTGAPIAVRIRLNRSATTATGYAWAGGSGPAVKLTSGTIATVDVTVSRQAPITFALPFLRHSAGL